MTDYRVVCAAAEASVWSELEEDLGFCPEDDEVPDDVYDRLSADVRRERGTPRSLNESLGFSADVGDRIRAYRIEQMGGLEVVRRQLVTELFTR